MGVPTTRDAFDSSVWDVAVACTCSGSKWTFPRQLAQLRYMVEEDWREVRARLVAGENKDKEGASSASDTASLPAESGFVYESPLIEQGTVLLGGTKQLFGFALRSSSVHSECVCTTCVLQLLFFNCYSSTAVLQQNVFFNCCSSTECVLLLLQHDEGFTKGIILNRPTAIELDGWRLWCGHGQVAEGGMFVGADKAKGELEINCLHSLDGFMAQRVSTNVIKGVSVTSLEGAKALVAAGQAKKEDFWVTVGYSGWAPGQLQMEVDTRDSWYLASAAGDTLLRELLQQAKDLPPPSASSGAISAQALIGIDTWARLMRQIGRGADVAASEGVLADRMLAAWVRARGCFPPPKASPPPMAMVRPTKLRARRARHRPRWRRGPFSAPWCRPPARRAASYLTTSSYTKRCWWCSTRERQRRGWRSWRMRWPAWWAGRT